MEILQEKNDKALILKLNGRLDALTSGDFEKEINEIIAERQDNLILDFSNLMYISSAGLRSILKLVKQGQAKHFEIYLINLQKSVFEVFKISGFASFLHIEQDLESALAKL